MWNRDVGSTESGIVDLRFPRGGPILRYVVGVNIPNSQFTNLMVMIFQVI